MYENSAMCSYYVLLDSHFSPQNSQSLASGVPSAHHIAAREGSSFIQLASIISKGGRSANKFRKSEIRKFADLTNADLDQKH